MMPYDLLWPVSTRLDAGIPEAKVVEEVGGTQKNRSSMSCDGGSTSLFFFPFTRIPTDESSIQLLHLF